MQVPETYIDPQYSLYLQDIEATGETRVILEYNSAPDQDILNNITLEGVMVQMETTKEIEGNTIVITCSKAVNQVGSYDLYLNATQSRAIEIHSYEEMMPFGAYNELLQRVWPT